MARASLRSRVEDKGAAQKTKTTSSKVRQGWNETKRQAQDGVLDGKETKENGEMKLLAVAKGRSMRSKRNRAKTKRER